MKRIVFIGCILGFLCFSGCQTGISIEESSKNIVVTPWFGGKIDREVNIGGCVVAFSTAWYAEYGSTAVSLATLYDFAEEDGHIDKNEVTLRQFGNALRYYAGQDIDGYDIQRVVGTKHKFRVTAN